MASRPLLLSLLVGFIGLLYRRVQQTHPEHLVQFAWVAFLSVGGYFLALKLIPIVKVMCVEKGNLYGYDINKNGKEKIPESLGIVVGTVWIMVVIMFQPLFHESLGQYNAALISVCWMIMLGFTDDVLDLRWAYKIVLSFLATLPLLVAYSGPTNIIVPKPLRDYLGLSVDLGLLYSLYMMFIAVFCTNSINIYAGINGLEATQSAVIAGAVLVHNFIELGGSCANEHLLSAFLILPFLAVTLALIYYNWYPSSVFVGDTFTYFAGMTLAVAGIQGHFTKTLMLFFAPELINFILSLPQLIPGVIPCPRHRLPRLNPETGLLQYSYAVPEKKIPNLTLLNAFLWVFGPMHERTLCIVLTAFHIFCCAVGFAIRYSETVTNIFYDNATLLSKC